MIKEKCACHVCGHDSWKFLYNVRDVNQDIKGSWRLISCEYCNLACLSPFPSPEVVASFYDDRFYTSDGKRFSGIVEWLRKILGYYRVKKVEKYLPSSPGHLLDFGSGAGHFGKAIEKKGWKVTNEDIAFRQGSRVQMDKGKLILDYPDNFFDIVSMWYVIEHMVSPRHTLRELCRVLKPGGILITAQQDFSSYQARLFGVNWLILDPPRHIFQFSPENLVKLSVQEGFRKVGINRHSIEFGPFTLLQSFLNCLLGNNNYLFKFIKNRKLESCSTSREKILNNFYGIISFLLSIGMIPLVFTVYFLLLALGSGDIFTLFLKKKDVIS